MKRRLFWIGLYGWALVYHGLLWVHVTSHGTQVDRAIVTMALGLIIVWGVFFARVQVIFMRLLKPKYLARFWYFLSVILGMISLALVAEMVSTTMTQTAYLWKLSPNDAYITASPNYIEVVTRHSVIVFIPQFIGIAFLHYHYAFKPIAWFIIYGLMGYVNERLAFGAVASWVSIPFWMIVYGWIAYLPTYLIIPKRKRRSVKWFHYGLAFAFPLALSIPWALVIITWLHN